MTMLPPPTTYFPAPPSSSLRDSSDQASPRLTFVDISQASPYPDPHPQAQFLPSSTPPDMEILQQLTQDEALTQIKRDGEGLHTLTAMRSISMRFLRYSLALRQANNGFETKESLTFAALAATQLSKHACYENSQKADLNVKADGDSPYEIQLRQMYDLAKDGLPKEAQPQLDPPRPGG